MAEDGISNKSTCKFEGTLSIEHARKLIKEVNVDCAEEELYALLDSEIALKDSAEIYILLGNNLYLKYYYSNEDVSDSVFSLFYKAYMIDTFWTGTTVGSEKRMLNLMSNAKTKAIVDHYQLDNRKNQKGKSIFKKWWLYPAAGAVGAILYFVVGSGGDEGRHIPNIPDPPSK